MNNFVMVLSLMAVSLQAQAEVRLAAFFNNDMVLQRDKPVPVWGWANPGEEVAVTFAGQVVKTKAAVDGKWTVTLAPLATSAEGRELIVRGSAEIVLKNVVVGDVWICSGQSNMATGVWECLLPEEEKKRANYPLIRQAHFGGDWSKVPQNETTCGKWTLCGPNTVLGFCAVGYFFARKLHEELDIPIGLLVTAAGGNRIEPWIPAEAFKTISELKEISDLIENVDITTEAGNQAYVQAVERLKGYIPFLEKCIREKRGGWYPIPNLPLLTLGADHCGLYNSRVLPLAPFALKGVIWYQGESNGGEGESYYFKMRALIEGWRKLWNEELPFYFVQLANWQQPNPSPEGDESWSYDERWKRHWSRTREAQMRCLTIPKTGMAVTIDINANGDIHPKNKQDMGLRLALWALAKDYGRKDLVYSGPLYQGMSVDGHKIRLRFNQVGSGLMIGEKIGLEPTKAVVAGELKGFTIAGKDGKWVWAKAVIAGDEVVVSSPEVKEPVAARYAFSINPAGCNLYNREGLPASPFRTDSWE